MNRGKITIIAFMAVFLISLNLFFDSQQIYAQQNKEESAEVKTLIGEVAGFMPRNDPQPKYVAIAYEPDNADYYFIIDESIKIINKKFLSEIQVGDLVEVTYHVEHKKSKKGEETTEHVAKKIRFVRPIKQQEILSSDEK